jgi:hypothetical protein
MLPKVVRFYQKIMLPRRTVATDEMSIDERYQYLKRMQLRYAQADRETKKQLLD